MKVGLRKKQSTQLNDSLARDAHMGTHRQSATLAKLSSPLRLFCLWKRQDLWSIKIVKIIPSGTRYKLMLGGHSSPLDESSNTSAGIRIRSPPAPRNCYTSYSSPIPTDKTTRYFEYLSLIPLYYLVRYLFIIYFLCSFSKKTNRLLTYNIILL